MARKLNEIFVSKEQTGSETANAKQCPEAILPTEKSPSTVSSEIVGHASATPGPGTSVDATVPVATEEVEVANVSVEGADDILPTPILTQIFTKSCSRRNFAVRMIRHLIDKETRKRSNVNGRGKEQLDPQIVKFAKAQCFEYFPCASSAIKEEWSKCVISINESCRRLMNKPTKSSSVD